MGWCTIFFALGIIEVPAGTRPNDHAVVVIGTGRRAGYLSHGDIKTRGNSSSEVRGMYVRCCDENLQPEECTVLYRILINLLTHFFAPKRSRKPEGFDLCLSVSTDVELVGYCRDDTS